MKTIGEHIQENIELTAKRLRNGGIVTAEQMIPEMEPEDYPPRNCLDIAYAEDTEWEKLDIFYPEEGDGPFPVFIEVHGGAWYFGQKRSIEFQPFLYGLKKGFACISVGYTLSPQAVYPQAVEEIKTAVAYLRRHAERLMLDAGRFTLWGGSAGAQLAAQAAFTGADVQVLVLWFGCYDYFQDRNLEDWVYENYLGTNMLAQAQERLRELNPMNRIGTHTPFVILQHGLQDTVVPYMQSVRFYEKLCKAAGKGRCMLELTEGCEHADSRLFAEDNIRRMFHRIIESLGMEQNEA